MTIKYKPYLLFFIVLLLISCKVEPKSIAYNQDQCHSCKMMISDPRFGSELVTKKGKVYKYDAIECMVRDLIKNGESNYAHILITDYHEPKKLIDATQSIFLFSSDRPSPMGSNLTAYKSRSHFDENFEGLAPPTLQWQDLLDHYKE